MLLLRLYNLHGNLRIKLLKNSKYILTGVCIIGPVGIGEVQMTTFFYGTKSLLKMSFRILLIFLDGDLTEDKEKCLGPPLS